MLSGELVEVADIVIYSKFFLLFCLLQVLALKHHTSKLSDFPDLQSLTSFGFRGEALSSLCALANLTVETRTKNESVATHLSFDHSGLLTAEKKTARQVGTTVTVKKLFCNLPVRSKEFSRNIRKEYGKLISLLNVSLSFCKNLQQCLVLSLTICIYHDFSLKWSTASECGVDNWDVE